MKKKLTEAKKSSLINRGERVMGNVIELLERMREAGINTSIYSQQSTRPIRALIDLISRS